MAHLQLLWRFETVLGNCYRQEEVLICVSIMFDILLNIDNISNTKQSLSLSKANIANRLHIIITLQALVGTVAKIGTICINSNTHKITQIKSLSTL